MSTAARLGAPAITDHRRSRLGRERRLADLIGLGPITLIYGVFILVPIVGLFVLSFFTWNGLGSLTWAGLTNWRQLINDPTAGAALEVTLKVVNSSWLIQTPIAMALGIFVAGRGRVRSVYAGIYVLPLLLSTAGIALMWQALLNPDLGGLVYLAHTWHLSWLNQNWLGGLSIALPTLIVINAWQWIPFHTLLYQTGRRNIPDVLYEAAAIDGATGWQAFWHITLPAGALHGRHLIGADRRWIAHLFRHLLHPHQRRARQRDACPVVVVPVTSRPSSTRTSATRRHWEPCSGSSRSSSRGRRSRFTGFASLRSQQAGIA